MKRPVIFAPLARVEFEDAAAWYEEERPGLGAEFRDAVNETIEQVSFHPERFRLVAPATRRAVLRRFPYSIYYSIGLDAIKVTSVFHGARNPAGLRRRLE
jgi:plasmid stabilization system protein ParE